MQICRVERCGTPVFVKKRGLCKMHYHRFMRHGDPGMAERRRVDGAPEERWMALVSPESPGCWTWVGALDKHGYGQFQVTTDGARKNWRAHRWVYTQLVRPLEDSETLDHLCRVHACVNPDHLEPVSQPVNAARGYSPLAMHARKTHCPNGHLYDMKLSRGARGCRRCRNEQRRKPQIVKEAS